MLRSRSLQGVLPAMLSVLLSFSVAGQTPRQVSVEMSGISTFVFTASGAYVLYPNLTDLSWLSSRFTFDPGDIAYHQLRIYFDRCPTELPDEVWLSKEFPCYGEEDRWWTLNASEDLPGMTFELESIGTITTESSSNEETKLPVLGAEMFKANWPVTHRKIHQGFLRDALTLEDARRLTGRLLLPDVSQGDLEIEPLPNDYRLRGRVMRMPRRVVWRGRTSDSVKLCFRELTIGSKEGQSRCIEWSAAAGDLRLLFEHQPPHVRGIGCRGGRRDFVAHYALYDGIGLLPSLPMPLIDTGKKGWPAPADDAMCSPAEGK